MNVKKIIEILSLFPDNEEVTVLTNSEKTEIDYISGLTRPVIYLKKD